MKRGAPAGRSPPPGGKHNPASDPRASGIDSSAEKKSEEVGLGEQSRRSDSSEYGS